MTMTQKTAIPTQYSHSQWMRPSLMRTLPFPFIPSMGFPAIVCGALGIASVLAPEWVEGYIPHFRERYLPIVSIVIVVALLSSLWRLIKATAGTLFFGVAALGLLYSFHGGFTNNLTHNLSLPNFLRSTHYSESTPAASSRAMTQPSHSINGSESAITPRNKLPPALPDEAYFPKARSNTEGIGFGGIRGGNSILERIKDTIR